MGRILADGIGTVVAARAIARDIDVIKVSRYPRHSDVAVVAGVAARDVCRVLAGRNVAVVAGIASANDLCMIHHGGRRPEIDAMAIFADRGRRNVRGVLAGCVGAIVAARAITDYVCVIEVRRCPGNGRVAIIAVVVAGQVRRVFAACGDAVMAGAATA